MLRKRPTSICSSSTLSHLAAVSPYPNTKPISAGSSQVWGANAVCAAWESFTPQWFILHTNHHSSCFFVCLPNSGTENLHQVNLIMIISISYCIQRALCPGHTVPGRSGCCWTPRSVCLPHWMANNPSWFSPHTVFTHSDFPTFNQR